MIDFARSTSALKIPMPARSLPSVMGQTMGSSPPARRRKFLLPCSQMTFSATGRLWSTMPSCVAGWPVQADRAPICL